MRADACYLVVRVASPVDGLCGLGPKPHNQVAAQARHPHGQHATGHRGDVGTGRVVAQQRIGGINGPLAHVEFSALVQPISQRVKLRVRRRAAHAQPAPHVKKRRTIGLHRIEQCRLAVEKRHQVTVLCGFADELLVHLIELEPIGLLRNEIG